MFEARFLAFVKEGSVRKQKQDMETTQLRREEERKKKAVAKGRKAGEGVCWLKSPEKQTPR